MDKSVRAVKGFEISGTFSRQAVGTRRFPIVPRATQDFRPWKSLLDAAVDLVAGELGHDGVQHDQRNRAAVLLEQPQGLLTVGGRQHRVAGLLQGADGQVPNHRLVFGDEDRLFAGQGRGGFFQAVPSAGAFPEGRYNLNVVPCPTSL